MAATEATNQQSAVSGADSAAGVEKFSNEVLLWAYDYLHQRHANLDFTSMMREMVCDEWDVSTRRKCGELLINEGRRLAYQRRVMEFFPQFRVTNDRLEAKSGVDGLSKEFAGCLSVDDVICVIFRCNTSMCNWETVMLSVLITVEFIRHCSDGRMRSEYIKSLLEGLRCVIRRLDSSLSSLKGWEGFMSQYERPPPAICNTEDPNPCSVFNPCYQPPTPCPQGQRSPSNPACPSPCPPCFPPPYCQPPMPCYPPQSPPCQPFCPTPQPCCPTPQPCYPPSNFCMPPPCDNVCIPGQSGLRIPTEAREITLDLLEYTTGVTLSHLSQLDCEQKKYLERRMMIVRRIAEDKHGNKVMACNPGVVTKLSCAYHNYIQTSQLVCKLRDILDKDVLQLSCTHGWDSVAAVFILIRDLATLAKMSSCPTDTLSIIVDSVHAAFKQNEALIMSLLGTFAEFEMYYQCRV